MQINYQKAIDWIRENWTKSTECPICGSDNWGIGPQIVEMRSSELASPLYPLFYPEEDEIINAPD